MVDEGCSNKVHGGDRPVSLPPSLSLCLFTFGVVNTVLRWTVPLVMLAGGPVNFGGRRQQLLWIFRCGGEDSTLGH